jgi:hypothetical protein
MKDYTAANILTFGSITMSVMDVIPLLTILSLLTAVCLNVILIYKNTKEKIDHTKK